MNGFDTGHKDSWSKKPFLVGSKVQWIDSEGWTCTGEIIIKDGCKIGVESWEGFIFVSDFTDDYRVID